MILICKGQNFEKKKNTVVPQLIAPLSEVSRGGSENVRVWTESGFCFTLCPLFFTES